MQQRSEAVQRRDSRRPRGGGGGATGSLVLAEGGGTEGKGRSRKPEEGSRVERRGDDGPAVVHLEFGDDGAELQLQLQLADMVIWAFYVDH